MTVETEALAWLQIATPDELRAFALFREAGCPSCGINASPGCICWPAREIEYLQKVVAK